MGQSALPVNNSYQIAAGVKFGGYEIVDLADDFRIAGLHVASNGPDALLAVSFKAGQ